MVQSGVVPLRLSRTAGRITSSAIRDLLDVASRPGVISLAGGLPAPSSFPSALLADAVAAELRADPGGALQYSTTQGEPALRSLIAAGRRTTAERVVVTHGSQQGLDLLARVLVDPGEVVALADPGYPGAIQAFALAGATLVGLERDGRGLRIDTLEGRLRAGLRPRVVYVVPEFDNPTGATLPADRRAGLVRLAHDHDFVVVADDPYRELRWQGRAVDPPFPDSDRLVTLGSFSKVLSPGLRIGYVIAPPAVVEALVLVKQAADLHTSTLAQRVTVRVLSEPDFAGRHLPHLRSIYRQRAAALDAALRATLGGRLRWSAPDGGMFVWATFDEGGRATADTGRLLALALEEGVAFVPGTAFGIDGDHRRSLRLSFATGHPAELIEAVGRLSRAVERLDGR